MNDRAALIELLAGVIPAAKTPAITAAALRMGLTDDARHILINGIRNDGWNQSRLWSLLPSTMASPRDYDDIRALWLSAPQSAKSAPSALRAVARAACMAGAHEEARLLLRRLCVKVLPATVRRPGVDGHFSRRAALALSDLRLHCMQFGSVPFLISGTLLGYAREGKIIGWDKDIDVGVFGTLEQLIDLGKNLSATSPFHVRRIDFVDKRLRVRHWNKVDVDIFLHYQENDRIWHDGSVARWWNSPFGLKTASFLGVEQSVPEDPERYLSENYGNWRVPDPYFDARYDAPNLEVTDAEYRDSLLYFSLADAVRKGIVAKVERYKAMVRSIDPYRDWLDRVS